MDSDDLLRRFRASADIQGCYEIAEANGQISLLMRDSIFLEPGPTDGLQFAIRVLTGGSPLTYAVPLDRFRSLGTLMPLLHAGHSEPDVKRLLSERLHEQEAAWANELLTWLRSNRCFASGYRQPVSSIGRYEYPGVMLVSHTSLLFRSERSAVLTDPLVWKQLSSRADAFETLRIPLGAICCTHSHWDHCNLQTLMWLDKEVPILIPKIRHPSAFNPPIAPVLKALGFGRIHEVNLWEPVQVQDIEIVPVPFYGEEDEPGAEIDHYTYVLRTKGFTVYGGVDCFRDGAGDMKPVFEPSRSSTGPTFASFRFRK